MNCAGMIRTTCPAFANLRSQNWEPGHASMATIQGFKVAANSPIRLRLSFFR